MTSSALALREPTLPLGPTPIRVTLDNPRPCWHSFCSLPAVSHIVSLTQTLAGVRLNLDEACPAHLHLARDLLGHPAHLCLPLDSPHLPALVQQIREALTARAQAAQQAMTVRQMRQAYFGSGFGWQQNGGYGSYTVNFGAAGS